MKVIHGKKALVTGAASGIGRAIAIHLAREKADLFIIDDERLQDAANACRSEGAAEVITHICDLSDPDQIDRCIEQVNVTWDRLDIVVNNAGIAYYGRTARMTTQQADRLLAVNLEAPVRIIVKLIPKLMAQDGAAHIVNIASITGLIPKSKLAVYAATKHGLVGLSMSLRHEISPIGIGVSVVCPGVVETGITDRADGDGMMQSRALPVPRVAQTSADQVAAKTIAAIRKNKGLVLVNRFDGLLRLFHFTCRGPLDFFRHRRRSPRPVKSE